MASRNSFKYFDHAEATVAQPIAYSENQIPADDPGENFAERGVGVGVGAAGDGRHRREFGVAQGGERAAQAGDGEGDDHGGSGIVGGRAGRSSRRCPPR